MQITATSSSTTNVTTSAQGLSVSATLQPGIRQTGQPHVVISTQLMPQKPVQSMRVPDDSFLTRDAATIKETTMSLMNTLACIPEADVTLSMQQDMQRLKDQGDDSDDCTGAVFTPPVKLSIATRSPQEEFYKSKPAPRGWVRLDAWRVSRGGHRPREGGTKGSREKDRVIFKQLRYVQCCVPRARYPCLRYGGSPRVDAVSSAANVVLVPRVHHSST